MQKIRNLKYNVDDISYILDLLVIALIMVSYMKIISIIFFCLCESIVKSHSIKYSLTPLCARDYAMKWHSSFKGQICKQIIMVKYGMLQTIIEVCAGSQGNRKEGKPIHSGGGVLGGIAEEAFPEVVKSIKEERVLRINYLPIIW